jgi:hypothetical protein
VVSAALEQFIERLDLCLYLAAGFGTETGERLREHIAVLERIATRAPGVHRVLQKA